METTKKPQRRSLSQYSDAEVHELYEKNGKNAAKASMVVGCGPSAFKERIRMLSDDYYLSEKEKMAGIAFLADELEARGINPMAVNIKSAKVRTNKKRWNAMHKDADNKAVISDLKGDTRDVVIEFSPKFSEGPAWPVIQPAPRSTITYLKKPHRRATGEKRTFIWPDTQIGYYRNIETDKLVPFHDLRAIDVALQMLADFEANEVVILGDFLDLPAMSRWLQLPEFQLTTQPSIYFAYQVLARIRSIVGPDATMVFIDGNHERRMAEYVVTNAKAAYGLKPGWATPTGWPVHSIQYLLGFDRLKIQACSAYPGGEYWIVKPKEGQPGGLVAVHAPENSIKKKLRASIVHGHHPQRRTDTTTVHYYHGSEEYEVHAIAGLMRIGNAEDSAQLSRSAVASNGVNMNWQQGVGTVISYKDGYFDVRQHKIQNGSGVMDGIRYFGNAKDADFPNRAVGKVA